MSHIDLIKQARERFAALERALLGNEPEAAMYRRWIAAADALLAQKEPEPEVAFLHRPEDGAEYPIYTSPPDLQEQAEWTPVESGLPESGRGVLLTIENERGNRKVIRANYAAKHTLEQSPECDGGEYDEEAGTYWCEEGWYEWNEFDEINWRVSDKPIAWAPLPKPYAAQESGN